MKGDQGGSGGADCMPASWQGRSPVDPESSASATKKRLAQLARAIEIDVIPRLLQAHRPGPNAVLLETGVEATPIRAEIQSFLDALVQDDEGAIQHALAGMRARGISVETLYLDLFAVVARELGEMWEDDTCDFTVVTVALGRLQRLLRELSPAFGPEIAHPANGRRVLLTQPPEEHHSFGLSMVAEFFRRDGWDVIGGIGAPASDPALVAQQEWVDTVGFSIGSEMRLDWLRDRIAAVRASTCNADLCVIVGGPLFALHPEWVQDVGADGSVSNGRDAPALAERLLASGQPRAAAHA